MIQVLSARRKNSESTPNRRLSVKCWLDASIGRPQPASDDVTPVGTSNCRLNVYGQEATAARGVQPKLVGQDKPRTCCIIFRESELDRELEWLEAIVRPSLLRFHAQRLGLAEWLAQEH